MVWKVCVGRYNTPHHTIAEITISEYEKLIIFRSISTLSKLSFGK